MKRPAPAAPETPHPMEGLLRMDRMPHIWCPTCGLGTVVTAFASALETLELPLDDVVVVSGIGCTGRVAGYTKVDSFHTTHGRAIPFATGIHLTNPKLKVVVISGDGDLISIGGNHFIHAARRNVDITVICVNNFIYAMTGGQVAPTTPLGANASTMPYGNFERPFNIPYLAESSGAVYVARWSALHVRRLTTAIARLGTGMDLMKFYHDNCVIKHGAPTRELDIGFQEEITVGKFVDIERPTYVEAMNKWYEKVLGDDYELYEGSVK